MSNRNNPNLPMLAIASYTPEEYAKLLITAIDASELQPSWEEWLQNINKTQMQLNLQGYQCVTVPIVIEKLQTFCEQNGLQNDGPARAKYAATLMREQELQHNRSLNKKVKAKRRK